MQPRQGVEVQEVVKESPTAAEVSAVEVQPEGPVEVVLEGAEGNSAGGALETKGVQNLESQPQEEEIAAENPENEPIVAQTVDFEPVPAVSQEAIDTLAAIMKESEVLTGAQTVAVEMAQPFSGEGEAKPVLVTRENGLVVGFQPVSEDGKAKPMTDGGREIRSSVIFGPQMGILPSGDTRSTVLVREGYWEGVVSAAAADGISIEEYLTRELGERLEDTFFGRR
jgi:hypothetical protein